MSDILDQAITTSETLMRHLYSLRKFATEKGKLDDQYKALSGSIDALKSNMADLQSQHDAKQSENANLAQQRGQLHQDLAALQREIADKRTELGALSSAVEQIQTMLRAA